MNLFGNRVLVLLSLLLLLVFVLVDRDEPVIAANYENCIKKKGLFFQGRIDSIYFDKQRRFIAIVDVGSGNMLSYDFLCIWNPENYFVIGDSVKKMAGDQSMYKYEEFRWVNIPCYEGFTCDKWKNMTIP